MSIPSSLIDRIKSMQETKKADEGTKYCDHPLCNEKLKYYYRSGPNMCPTHNTEYHNNGSYINRYASPQDLNPSDPACCEKRCTEFIDPKHKRTIAQFLFYCENCKKQVCTFCAKKCYRSGHALESVNYKSHPCENTVIISTKKMYEIRKQDQDGNAVKKIKIF